MTDILNVMVPISVTAVIAVAAVAVFVRLRRKRRAERLRRRGYKEYNRDRPKLVVDPAQADAQAAE